MAFHNQGYTDFLNIFVGFRTFYRANKQLTKNILGRWIVSWTLVHSNNLNTVLKLYNKGFVTQKQLNIHIKTTCLRHLYEFPSVLRLLKKTLECEVSRRPAHHVTQPASLHPAARRLGAARRPGRRSGTRRRVPGAPARGPGAARRPRAPRPAAGADVARRPAADVRRPRLGGPERRAAAGAAARGGAPPGGGPAARGGGGAAAGAGRRRRGPAEREHAARGPAEGAEGHDGGHGAPGGAKGGGATQKEPHGLLTTRAREESGQGNERRTLMDEERLWDLPEGKTTRGDKTSAFLWRMKCQLWSGRIN